MKYSYLLFPKFLDKCITLSYDDGVVEDKLLCDIMLQHGLKGTFNLNSGQFGKTKEDGRLTQKEVLELYNNKNFEVALHGSRHLDLTSVSTSVASLDVLQDKLRQEKLFNRVIYGMAYAFGTYNDSVINVLQNCGVKYSRTINSTNNFDLPTNFLTWHPTCHHNSPKLLELLKEFFKSEKSHIHCLNHPKLFYLWGHSYEFKDNNNWHVIKEFASIAGGREDVWYATNVEIYNYVTAFKNLQFSMQENLVYNPSGIDVYLNVNGIKVVAKKGKTIKIK